MSSSAVAFGDHARVQFEVELQFAVLQFVLKMHVLQNLLAEPRIVEREVVGSPNRWRRAPATHG